MPPIVPITGGWEEPVGCELLPPLGWPLGDEPEPEPELAVDEAEAEVEAEAEEDVEAEAVPDGLPLGELDRVGR